MKEVYFGIPNISAAAYFTTLKQKSGPVLFLAKNEEELEEFACSVKTFTDKNAVLFDEADALSLPRGLCRILEGGAQYLGATYEILQKRVAGKKDFSSSLINLQLAQNISRADLLAKLENCGYRREDFCEEEGSYAVRGSVIDIFSPSYENPCRIYFSANQITSLSLIDVETQNTKTALTSFTAAPLKSAQAFSTLLNWTKDFTPFLYNPSQENIKLFEDAVILAGFASDFLAGSDAGLRQNANFNGDLSLFDRDVKRLLESNFKLLLFCLNKAEEERLQNIFWDYDNLKKLALSVGPLEQGFYSAKEKFAYFTSAEILNRRYRRLSRTNNFDDARSKHIRFKELEDGDYIVHQDHGIGRYAGMQTLDNDGTPVDCLQIEYKRGEKLYVPITDFRKVQKYIGLKGKPPRVASLSSTTWKEVKKRVKEDAQKTAKEILKLEALRQLNKAGAMAGNETLERQFADSFPYEQTPDQSRAAGDILKDLTLERPMDRVLVGDVGFGKTEVAIRAALRVVLSARQVSFLVPTTVLAAQHFKTLSERLAAFPVNVAMLSRFQTRAEQKKVTDALKKGLVDIVIGTHRLLSKDVQFKNLGLCIIDEEHRFGVKQKEKIKAQGLSVHTLMLSATPIPRTLNQSLSSLREMSVIETPPQGRMPIKTRLLPYGEEIICQAVRDELARKGQIFYVYNRVESMREKLASLQALLPEVKIACAHGQMPERELEQTLWDFYNKKFDMLLASTIIESGLDITNANTLIIENAQNFGLAQLYQLRGRIGRGDTKAYCFLLHPDYLLKETAEKEEFETFFGKIPKAKKDIYAEAKKRLNAIMEFSELGSGFKLALRDLEIRGAGDILGIRQHGYVNAVGLCLYCDLVADEVKKLKGEPIKKQFFATINLNIPAYLPPDYMPNDAERLRYYKELMDADYEGKQKILKELEDISGPAPQELKNLLEIMQLSREAGLRNLRAIDVLNDAYGKHIDFYFSRNFKTAENALAAFMQTFGQNLKFLSEHNGDGLRLFSPLQNPLEETLALFEKIAKILDGKTPTSAVK